MKHRNDFDIATIAAAFDYNADTGVIKWRVPTGRGKSGEEAGTNSGGRHRRITFLGREYAYHRMAWLLHYKSSPPAVIDHINGDVLDNRISNLRDGTRGVNQQNQTKPHTRNKTSKYIGVSNFNGRWRAKIYHSGKYIFLGYHATEEDARDAYISAKRLIHEGCEL